MTIPDEVLREIEGAFVPGGPLAEVPGVYNFETITKHGKPLCSVRDLARQLLACREALRAVVENGPCSDSDCCDTAMKCEAARQAARRCLEGA